MVPGMEREGPGPCGRGRRACDRNRGSGGSAEAESGSSLPEDQRVSVRGERDLSRPRLPAWYDFNFRPVRDPRSRRAGRGAGASSRPSGERQMLDR